MKQKTGEVLKVIQIDKFKNCLEQWKKYFARYNASNGEYFEGD